MGVCLVQMFDSVNIDQIPADAPAVAGYTSGSWPTYPKLAVRWPNAHLLSIAINFSHDADCLDIEAGDASVADAPAWVRRQWGRGVGRPCLYTSISQMQSLINVLSASQIPRNRVRLWAGHYTYLEHICTPARCTDSSGKPYTVVTVDGTQWTNHALGRNLDQSLLNDSFFSIPPNPDPVPTPSPVTGVTVDMTTLKSMFVAPGVLPLRPDGTGWTPDPLPVPFERITGIFVQGSNPETDGDVWSGMIVEAQERDGNTEVTVRKLEMDKATPGFFIRWLED